jgi:hypothetical protein
MPFESLADIKHTPDRNDWTVSAPLTYLSFRLDKEITVPAGVHTDLGSTPRLAWFLIPPSDKHLVEPSIVHDWLYQNCGMLGVFTRKQCDQLLRDACKSQKAPKWYYNIVYSLVRAFGWRAWNRYKKRLGG